MSKVNKTEGLKDHGNYVTVVASKAFIVSGI